MATLADKLETLDALCASQKTEIETLGATVKKLTDDSVSAKAKISELDTALAASKTEIETLKASAIADKTAKAAVQAELDKAKLALQNPAFAHAANLGGKPVAEGGQDKGKIEFASQEEALAAYNKIEGAKERAQFRKDNKEILGL